MKEEEDGGVAGILSEVVLTSTESFVKHILTNVYMFLYISSFVRKNFLFSQNPLCFEERKN